MNYDRAHASRSTTKIPLAENSLPPDQPCTLTAYAFPAKPPFKLVLPSATVVARQSLRDEFVWLPLSYHHDPANAASLYHHVAAQLAGGVD